MRLWPFSRRSQPAMPPRDPGLVGWLLGDRATSAGVAVTVETALRCPAVYSCVGLIADAIATLPLHLYERKGDDRTVAESSPLNDLVHSVPSVGMTSVEWRQQLGFDLLTHGNHFARIRLGRDGLPASIFPERAAGVSVRRLDSGDPTYTVAASNERVPAEQMLHVRRRPLDDDRLRGRSVVELHSETIGRAVATAEYLSRFFRNGARPSLALTTPGILKQEAADKLRESWEKRHAGAENAHRIAVLDAGVDIKNLSLTNEQAQAVELYREVQAEIAGRIYGVPPHMVGLTDKTTSWGTGIESQTIGFVVYVIRPYLTLIEQTLNATLLSAERRRSLYFEFNLEGLLRGDFKSRMDGYALMVQWGIATANECRKRENMPSLPGGDERLMPLNMVPVSMIKDVLLSRQGKPANDPQPAPAGSATA